MGATLQQLVWERAGGLCEYCQRPQILSYAPFEIDDIIARKHRGKTVAKNLALSCFFCNNHKGPCIAGVDPETEEIVRLFHPRKDEWDEHFEWDGPLLRGLTAVGRTTIATLEINHSDYVAIRQTQIDAGAFPPERG